MIEHIAMVYAADDTLTSTEKHLLGAYCNHTDAHGYCWPGIDRLCHETNLSRATIKRTNASLRTKGLIKSVRRVNPRTGEPITNLTRVNVALLASLRRSEQSYSDNLVEAITFDEPTPESGSDLLMAHGEPDPGLKMSPTPAQNEPYLGLTVSPKTSLEPSVEPSSPPSPPPAPVEAAMPAEPPAGREEESATAEAAERAEALVEEAVRRWPSGHRAPGPRDRQRLSERVAAELGNDGDEAVILDELTRDLQDAGSAVRVVLGARTKKPGWGRSTDPRPERDAYTITGPKPAWCGACDERTRLVMAVTADGSERMRRCPACHPEPDPVVNQLAQERAHSGLSARARAATAQVRARLAALRS